MFYFSSMSMTEKWSSSGMILVYLSIIAIVAISIVYRRMKTSYNLYLSILIYGFVLFNIISALAYSNISRLISSLLFIILFISNTIIIPSYFKNNTIKVFIYTFLFSQIPIILIPMIIDGIETPYSGAFINTNSLGGVVITIFSVTTALLFEEVEKIIYKKGNSMSKVIFYIAISLLLFTLTILTNSRTSFLTGLVVILVGLGILVSFSVKFKLFSNLISKAVILVPILGILYYLFNLILPMNAFVQENIITKFERKSSDLLDGRGYLWQTTIKETGLFGNADGYFIDNFSIGPHNTFIAILGMYGWISLAIFVIFLLISVYYTFKYALNVDNQYRYLPILMLTTFIMLSMGEGMLYKSSMLASFILIGISANNKTVIVSQGHNMKGR